MRIRTSIAKNWIHHDNAPAHVAQFLTSKCITVMQQPPYSPDLAPGDLFLFIKIKSAVKGHHFEATEDIPRAVTQALNDFYELRTRNATSSGSTAGKGVCRHKGCTLKMTTL
jgi:hypothetical protein